MTRFEGARSGLRVFAVRGRRPAGPRTDRIGQRTPKGRQEIGSRDLGRSRSRSAGPAVPKFLGAQARSVRPAGQDRRSFPCRGSRRYGLEPRRHERRVLGHPGLPGRGLPGLSGWSSTPEPGDAIQQALHSLHSACASLTPPSSSASNAPDEPAKRRCVAYREDDGIAPPEFAETWRGEGPFLRSKGSRHNDITAIKDCLASLNVAG